jgi:hypothetical protein
VKVKFHLTVKRSTETLAIVPGYPVDAETLNAVEITQKILETEQFLEKLTGCRVHIDMLPVTEGEKHV